MTSLDSDLLQQRLDTDIYEWAMHHPLQHIGPGYGHYLCRNHEVVSILSIIEVAKTWQALHEFVWLWSVLQIETKKIHALAQLPGAGSNAATSQEACALDLLLILSEGVLVKGMTVRCIDECIAGTISGFSR